MFNVVNLEMLRRQVPSIFTEERATTTTNKYQHISTAKIIEGLASEGFMPTRAIQCQSRLATKKAYTKHMVRFRHVDARPTTSGLYPELVLTNSHDGLSSYRLNAGLYRMVCTNGLMAGNAYAEIRIRHQGDIIGDVIEGTYQIIDTSHKMLAAAEQMSAISLSDEEKQIFAEAAHTIRFDNSEIGKAIDPLKLLSPRRYEDNKSDLFTIFNVAQENIIKGGVRGYTRDSRGYPKHVRSRAVKGIDQNTTLNRALWTLAEKMLQLRGV